MATYDHFEDTPAWQSAEALYALVLDLLEEHGGCFSPGYRNQIDRAALSVSNNIAEGFERAYSNELLSFLSIARGSAGEVRSMSLVVRHRPKAALARELLAAIHQQAGECVRQITGWIGYLETSNVHGKRHLTPEVKARRQVERAVTDLRREFLLSLDPDHPLYHSPEARAARENQA